MIEPLSGEVCNKIGTYLKALAAYHNNIPLRSVTIPTIDWSLEDGVNSIPIEERSHEEVDYINGLNDKATFRK